MFATIIGIILIIISLIAFKLNRDWRNKAGQIVIAITYVIQMLCFYNVYKNWDVSDHKENYPQYFYDDCGVVTKHLEGIERLGKHHTETYKEYIVIKYDRGITEREEVNRNTYEKFADNSRICFERTTDDYTWFCLKRIGLIIIIIIGLIINFNYMKED
jgi:hypothetical protein